MATVRVVTPPAVEPVSVDEALAHSGAPDTPANRSLLEALIASAREAAEGFTSRALITQERALILERLPANGWLGLHALAPRHITAGSFVELPGGRLQSVEGVFVMAEDGSEAEADPSTYAVDAWSEPGRVRLRDGAAWPIVARPAGARIEYTVGYGSDASAVPAAIRQAVLLLVTAAYGRRDPNVQSETVGSASVVYVQSQQGDVSRPTLPAEVRTLLLPYRLSPGLS